MAVNRIYLWKNDLHFPLFASIFPSFLSGFISEFLISRYDLYNLINQSVKSCSHDESPQQIICLRLILTLSSSSVTPTMKQSMKLLYGLPLYCLPGS